MAGSAFEAGTDTTSVTILWFIMAMVLYPDTAIKAQNEIDALLGDDGSTIPGFEHMDGTVSGPSSMPLDICEPFHPL